METKKIPFFVKLKKSILNVDEYKFFTEEKTTVAIKYAVKLILIFTLIVTIALTGRVIKELNNLIADFQNECPEFSFKDNTLVIEGDNKKIVKSDKTGYFGLIVDNSKENLKDIEESGDYKEVIGFLKDKIVIKDANNAERSLTYENLNENYDLSNINRDTVLQYLSRK